MTEPSAPQKAEKGTTYVVLMGLSEHDRFDVVAEVGASSAAGAVKTVAAERGAATYIAVPARSWQPVKVTVETKQTVKLG